MKRTETITRTTVLLSIISSSSNKYSIAEDGFSFVHGTRRMQTRRTGASGTGEQAGQAVGIFQPFFLQAKAAFPSRFFVPLVGGGLLLLCDRVTRFFSVLKKKLKQGKTKSEKQPL